MHTLISCALALALAGCGTGSVFRGLAVSGEAIRGTGAHFESVAKVYKQGCDDQRLSQKDCTAFRVFGETFKKVYPVTADLWDTARRAQDTAVERRTRDVITQLAEELTRLALVAYDGKGTK